MLRVVISGSIHRPGEWGANFGPLSNVDEVIAGSNGLTLRKLWEAGDLRADVLQEEIEPELPALPADEPEEERD